jgi:hypothetical protein
VGLRQIGVERERLVEFLSRLAYLSRVVEGCSKLKMREGSDGPS